MEPNGTVVFTTVGRPNYGFDIFSVSLTSHRGKPSESSFYENRLTDGVSINFNGQFVDEEQALVYVTERTGSPRIYLNRPGNTKPQTPHPVPLPLQASMFLDRPIFKNRRLYFISAHEQPDSQFKSWSALYSVDDGVNDREKEITRLTPYGCADYSPSMSQSGNSVAVASYGSRAWPGEFHDLQTDIVVFPVTDPTRRVVVCEHGGWPTWCGDDIIYFHRQADDGWWSIFRLDLDLPQGFQLTQGSLQQQFTAPRRVTPPGLHCFTPAAMHGCRTQIAVATRRKGKNCRHVEIFDLELQKFYPVTELLNPDIHHYNPFVSPDSGFLGYHRFRGESAATGDMIIPHLEPVSSPCRNLQMLRLNGAFPSFSPDGDLIVFNPDFDSNRGIKLVRADGSKRWNLLEGRTAFCNSWSRADKNVIFTSIGPIFDTVKASVQVARVTFDPDDLGSDAVDIPAEVKVLTREETGNNAFPSCSPDGKYLVFRSGRSGYKNLYIVDAVEGEFNGGIRQLTEGKWIDTMPSWSPAENLIAFSSNRHNPENVDAFGVYVIRPDGTDLRRIYVAGPEGSEEANRERINHVCFSADGEWLLFAANFGGVTAEPVSLPNHFQPYGDLYVVRLDGSGLRRLTWNGYENGTPAWHPAENDELGSELGRRLSLESKAGDKLRGEFDEPLWIKCDM